MITKKVEDALNTISSICGKYKFDECHKCPLFLHYNGHCFADVGRAPEFWDTDLLKPVVRQITENADIRRLKTWYDGFTQEGNQIKLNGQIVPFGSYVIHDTNDSWIIMPKDKYELKYLGIKGEN